MCQVRRMEAEGRWPGGSPGGDLGPTTELRALGGSLDPTVASCCQALDRQSGLRFSSETLGDWRHWEGVFSTQHGTG
jgi:hypothetical protein